MTDIKNTLENKTWEGILGIWEQYHTKPIKLISSEELKESGLIEKLTKKILEDLGKL